MLSNPTTSNLHSRQRAQHRRQNSTPTAFEAVKIAPLPTMQQQQQQQRQQQVSHRRGLSLDTRRQQFQRHMTTHPSRQDFAPVSIAINTGSATSQHVLREAQQQRTARLGHGQPSSTSTTSTASFPTMSPPESYLLSPQGTPHSQRFDSAVFEHLIGGQQHNLSFDKYGAPVNDMIQKTQASLENSLAVSPDFELFGADSTLSTPTFMNFPDASMDSQGWISEGETASTRRSSRRISNGIMDRVSKFENLGTTESQRPVTPPNQNAQNYLPPTPTETPQGRLARQQTRPNRFSDEYDESMEETLKPRRGKSTQRPAGVFQDMRQQAEEVPHTPHRVNQRAMPIGTPEFMNMSNLNAEFLKLEGGFEGMTQANPLAMSPDHSQHSTPYTPALDSFGSAFDVRPTLQSASFDSQATILPNPAIGSPALIESPHRSSHQHQHRRTESVASITSAASISDIRIEETKTETGVTLEEISAFIKGPDSGDGKWVCTFEDCGKRFGRKENIKSHVQTHLNDRQYQCPHCHKCFVRQHDLKRHAKIHTGVKPYPCECGNSFARHDALTRHRQRGMCIGAFDGVVRKVVKRGRPRKNRPDMESRMEKAARTRAKNTTTSISSVSSHSGYSDSSAGNSPQNGFDAILEDMNFVDLLDSTLNGREETSPIRVTTMAMNPGALVSSAPMPTLGAHDMSECLSAVPRSQAASPSASPYSHRSHVSPAEIDNLPLQPGSPAKSVASHYTHHANSPPELTASCSSPAPAPLSSAHLFGVDPNSSGAGDSVGLTTSIGSGGSGGSGVGNISGLSIDEDILLQAFTNEDGLVSLSQDPNMLMLSTKFDEEYSLFASSDDMFFGSA